MEGREQTNYPLTLAGMLGRLLQLRVIYDRQRFDQPTIERMLGHLAQLLMEIVAAPTQQLTSLPMLAAAERQQLVEGWNATAAVYVREQSVHALVEAQAERDPSAPAVIAGIEQLSYGELNARANQLARYLRTLGVGAETPVGLCVERSIDLIVGSLGILKAGAAYLPLDVTYPQERIAFMLRDAQVPVVLTQQPLLKALPTNAARIVCLDSDWATIAEQSAESLALTVLPEQLAYVIYTSGSTGQPKGVQVEHQALLNLIFWHREAFNVSADDRATQVAGLAFDAAVWELWPYLTAGASISLPDEATRAIPSLLRDWLVSQQITITFLPTPLAEQVLALDWPSDVALRTLLTGGDKLRRAPALNFPATLVNNYGPTENTVVTTSGIVSAAVVTLDAPAIGRPIANTQVYLVNQALQPVPVGVVGELYVSGDSLARCYLDRPDLTAERFLPHPFSAQPGARWYRTGDLARYRADGTIEFLGRNDDQIKVRGYRIELAEIEMALGQSPVLQACVVVAQADARGEKQIVAYVVPNQDQAANVEDQQHLQAAEQSTEHGKLIGELRTHAAATLPEYMVPSAFVVLSELPLTPNGKVDRKALPAYQQDSDTFRTGYQEPRDVVELTLTRIWEEVLDLPLIGVTDNFFELGGHSLLAMQMISHIQQKFQRSLPLSTLFKEPTVAQLARVLRQQVEPTPWSPLVALQPRGTKRPLFCVHPAGGTSFCYTPLAQQLGPDQPVYGLQAPGLEEGQLPFGRLEDMAAAYVEAIRAIEPEGPYLLAGWSVGGLVAYEMAQQLLRQGHEVGLLALLDTTPPSFRPEGEDLSQVDDASLLIDLVRDNLTITADEFRQLDPNEQIRLAAELMQQANMLPPDRSVEQVRRILNVFKASLYSMLNYVPQPYPQRITLFTARMPMDPDEVVDTSNFVDPADIWTELSGKPIEIHNIPANHARMLFEPHVGMLAEQLRRCLWAVGLTYAALPDVVTSDAG
jgi:amino acid adenylation domain-containing protein